MVGAAGIASGHARIATAEIVQIDAGIACMSGEFCKFCSGFRRTDVECHPTTAVHGKNC